MSANLQLENQNLRLQVENLEVKMENLKLKHDEALRKVKAENDILKSLVDKNKATNNQIEAKNAEINNLERQLSEKNEENKKLIAKKKLELNKEKKKEEDEIEVKKKQAEELSEQRDKILEGIEKYVIRKRSTTKFFPTYDAWFSWIRDSVPFGTTKFKNCAFVRYSNVGKLIYFTEYAEFPVMSNKELVIPVVNEGWSADNTKGYLLRNIYSGSPVTEIETAFTEEINDPEFGRYFSIKIADSDFSYKNGYNTYFINVFVHQEVNEKQVL